MTKTANSPLLVVGDTFEIAWSEWYRMALKDTAPIAVVKKPVTCKVLRIYASSDRILYLCRAIAGTDPYKVGGEFVLEEIYV